MCTLGSAYLKPGHTVDRLIRYFERTRLVIPCYALRKQLRLSNSSNWGEKAHVVLVSHRQKHNEGMSGFREGSVTLATVKNVKR